MKKILIKWLLNSVLDVIGLALNELVKNTDTTVDDEFVITYAENKEAIAAMVLQKLDSPAPVPEVPPQT